MVEAGEISGTLDVILLRLAEFTESQNELANKVKSAMLYPIIVAVVTTAVLMIMFIFVVPKIMDIFDSSPEIVLPWYSVMVFDFSGFITGISFSKLTFSASPQYGRPLTPGERGS